MAATCAFVESYAPDGRVTVKLVGELDPSSRPRVERKLSRLAECADTTVDVGRTVFADPDSIRMLVSCAALAPHHGRAFEVVNAPAQVEQMLADESCNVPTRTTTDAERSQPDSEQIVRLQCATCGNQTFRPEYNSERKCENCGAELGVVAIFRNRRRLRAPVDVERRSR